MAIRCNPLRLTIKSRICHPIHLLIGIGFFFFSLAVSNNSLAEGKTVKNPSIEACKYVVSHANKGELNKILIQSEPWDSPKIKKPKDIPGFSGIVFRKLMDINNDGVLERVFVESQGTAHYEEFSVYELNKDKAIEIKTLPDDDWESNNLRWAADRAFIQFQGVTYILGKNAQSLRYLANINSKNEMKVVCEFGQREKHLQHIKSAQNDKVCKQALKGSTEYVKFNKLHSVSHGVVQKAGFYETHPAEYAALVDINNDGIKEIVISLGLASGRGPGCDSTFLGVLTADRSDIDKKFTEKLPGGKCGGTKVIPFVVDGKIYLDEKQTGPHAEHRQIYILEKDKLKTICEFEIHPDNYVLGEAERIEKVAAYQNIWEYAISQPGTAAVEALIKEGRHLNKALLSVKEATPDRAVKPIVKNPLNIAIWHKRYDLLEMLLKAGADPNLKIKDHFLEWPLVYAVYEDMPKAVAMLLKYGAEKNKIACNNALAWAISSGSVEMLELLLKSGVAITDRRAIEAVINNNRDKHKKLKVLIKHGLDVSKKYTDGIVIEGIKEVSPGVINVGPEIKTKKATKTLLEWAKESGDPEAVKILLDAGAKKADKSLLQKLKEADVDLNQSYKSLMSNLKEADRKKLQAEQKGWIHERDTKCDSFYKGKSLEDWLRNAAANHKRGLCVLEATKKRTTMLSLKLLHEVMPPDEKVADRSQIEWSQEYWAWSKLFPSGQKPSDDASGIRCAEKQSGPVWFLTGSSGSSPVVRNCVIPSGRHIFMPILVSLAEAKTQDKDCKRLLTMLDTMTTDIEDMRVEINGKNIPNFTFWRQTTECFDLKTREGTSFAASDGYWLMLKPLKSGSHTISFRGRFLTGGFSQNVQYNITVKP